MLDIGWSEMAIIAVVALFVIGPKELPRMLRTVGQFAGKIRSMAREFQDGIDEAVRETELDEVRKQFDSARRLDIKKSIEDAVDPERQIGKSMDFSNIGSSGADSPEAAPGAATEVVKPAEARPAQGMAASFAAGAAPKAAEPAAESGSADMTGGKAPEAKPSRIDA